MISTKIRLINFLLDTLIYLAFIICIIYLNRNVVAKENVKWLSISFYFLYYFLFEFFLKQTPAKLITKTKVISIAKNNNLFFFQIIIRTIIRFLPIDVISYFFVTKGLHDQISLTTVNKL